jgi:hypothetical protein
MLLRLGIAALVAAGVSGTLPARLARAQDPDALAKVRDLNKKAIDAYENLEAEEARNSLMTALQVCATEGLNRHPLKATTHLNLGVVLSGGLKQREAGVKQFRRALEIDPNIKVPKRLTSPEIQSAFDAAVKEIASGAPPIDGPALGGPPPASPPVTSAPPAGGSPIVHTPVTDARPAEDIVIKARVDQGLRLDRVVLAYRPEGASDFLARDMEMEGAEYVARIPEAAARGGSVAYYIEARGRGGQSLARNGSPDEPHLATLVGADGEAVGQVDSGDEPEDVPGGATRGVSGLWLSLGIGAGGGYAKGKPEVNPNYWDTATATKREIEVSSMAAAKLMHFVPEVGYFVSPQLLLSVQGRFQYTTGATEVRHDNCKPNGVCKPATGAVAVMAKATYLFTDSAKLRPYVSLMAGGGYIRYLVNLEDFLTECGPNQNEACLDTVAGGGALIGPSAGVHYNLTKGLYLTGALSALFGLPKTAINVDLNVGLGYKL